MKKTFVFFISISLILILSFLIFNLKKVEITEAGTGDNVYGWAWSDNIGWISFNCTDQDSCLALDYGVNIDSGTGILSGYAWSDNIGWITFNSGDLGGCPSGDCEARINLTNMEISGWARACAGAANPDCTGGANPEAGGWDGWINLKDITIPIDYGIWLDDTIPSSPVEFRDWAWGSDVFGWVSFNSTDCDTDGNGFIDVACGGDNSTTPSINYKVMTSLGINQNPYIELGSPTIVGTNFCLGGGRGQISLEWTYIDNDGDDQVGYWLEVDDGSGWTLLGGNPSGGMVEVDPGVPGIGTAQVITVVVDSPNPNNFEVEYNKTYNWRVMVEDSAGNQSFWVSGPPINIIPSHARPFPDFNPSPLNAFVDEPVNFSDISKCYLVGGASYDCKNEFDANGTDNVSYTWDFDYPTGIDDFTEGDITYTYASDIAPGIFTVRLEITDDIGIMCPAEESVFVEEYLPVPKWKEVSPFYF